MNQWLNETLVAIEQTTNGKYRVIELPPRATTRIVRRRWFATVGRAETYIAEEWFDRCIVVQVEGITEEIERRSRASDKIASVLAELQGILEQIQACQDLPDWTKAREAGMSHEEWMALSEKLQVLNGKADTAALSTVPNSVYVMLFKIRGAWISKHDWGKPKQKESGDATN